MRSMRRCVTLGPHVTLTIRRFRGAGAEMQSDTLRSRLQFQAQKSPQDGLAVSARSTAVEGVWCAQATTGCARPRVAAVGSATGLHRGMIWLLLLLFTESKFWAFFRGGASTALASTQFWRRQRPRPCGPSQQTPETLLTTREWNTAFVRLMAVACLGDALTVGRHLRSDADGFCRPRLRLAQRRHLRQ